MLPGPFLGWLATLMFLLVMQFLIRYLPDLVGRGLPLIVFVEIIAYNLAYMVVLAVPMSVLIATLMTFGKLAEANVYTVLKSSGVSLLQLIWPVLLVSLLVTAVMWRFNSEVLPAANFRASSLWKDIRKKRPGFELKEGVFYDGITNYSILVQEMPAESNELIDVTIYDYSKSKREQIVIKAQHGTLEAKNDGLQVELFLYDGQIHRVIPPKTRDDRLRYEVLTFGEHRLVLDLSELSFERSDPKDGYRSDRTMPSALMIQYVDSLKASIENHRTAVFKTGTRWMADSTFTPPTDQPTSIPIPSDTASVYPTKRVALSGMTKMEQERTYESAMNTLRANRTLVENTKRTIEYESERANRYWVEIHKKYSIAVACLIFALIGLPLGLSMKRGGLGAVGATALGIFMFYWVTLVQGEKLADREKLIPWVGMWGANLVMLVMGIGLIIYVLLDLRARRVIKKRAVEQTSAQAD